MRDTSRSRRRAAVINDSSSNNEDDDGGSSDSDNSAQYIMSQMEIDERYARKLEREERRVSTRVSASAKRGPKKKLSQPTHELGGDREGRVLTYRVFGRRNGRKTVPSEIGPDLDRDISCSDTLSASQYHPQLGDRVIYFPQGHLAVLENFKSKFDNGSQPWRQFPQPWPAVECEVIELTYDMPNSAEYQHSTSVVANLKLKFVNRPSRWDGRSNDRLLVDFGPLVSRSTRHSSSAQFQLTFDVMLRLWDGVTDFIIPKHQYLKGVTYPWRSGVLFTTEFKVFSYFISKRTLVLNCEYRREMKAH